MHVLGHLSQAALDVFSFGVLLWSLWTKERPYAAQCAAPAQPAVGAVVNLDEPMTRFSSPTELLVKVTEGLRPEIPGVRAYQ